jgi:hypothetical protein
MNKKTAVDVFFGEALTDATEQKFLARLRRDLEDRGVSALVLANLQAGRGCRQLDFVIVTPARVVQCELKGFRTPVVGGLNGPWHQVLPGGSRRQLRDNAFRQAQDATFALSDELRDFVRRADVPQVPKGRYFAKVDTVVCVFPAVMAGSKLAKHQYVSVVGYEDLLARLAKPGPRLPWTSAHWDEFIRHLGLYRESDTSTEALSRTAKAAILEDYQRRFLAFHTENLAPRVPTKVIFDDRTGADPDPDIAGAMTEGESVTTLGPSGVGKTHLARHAAVNLASEGHLPIWLDAHAYAGSMETLLAQATAPFATNTPPELIDAAREAGRVVALVVDGLNECPEPLRGSLLNELAALRLQMDPAILLTSQLDPSLPEALRGPQLNLALPDAEERAAVLRTYNAPQLIDQSDAFKTPFELSIAAECATELGPIPTRGELLDVYIHRRAGSEPVRAGLRRLAWQMHEDLRGSLRVQDALRLLERNADLSPESSEEVLACGLVAVHQGLFVFTHEEFARFLAAEFLVVNTDDEEALAKSLAEPRHARLRSDALSLEQDADRVNAVIQTTSDGDLLHAAASGSLGEICKAIASERLGQVLDIAIERTNAQNAKLHATEAIIGDKWEISAGWTSSEIAALATVGELLHDAAFIERTIELLIRTDELCRIAVRELQESGETDPISHVLSATYGLIPNDMRTALPGSIVMRACEGHRIERTIRSSPSNAAAAKLWESASSSSWGVLYAFAILFDPRNPDELALVPVVLEAAWKERGYHLRLEALQMVERAAGFLEGEAREKTAEILQNLDGEHLLLNSALIDALAAFDLIDSEATVDEVREQIREGMRSDDAQIAQSLALRAVNGQFEDERIVGPYARAIAELEPDERWTLFRMAAAAAKADDLATDWIVEELASHADLGRADIRAVFERFAQTPDPSSWFAPQHGVTTHIRAIRACAEFCDQPPLTHEGTEEIRAWAAVSELVFWMERDALDLDVDHERSAELWSTLLGELRPAAADVLHALNSAEPIAQKQANRAHERLIARHANEVRDLLTWSLSHRDELASVRRFVQEAARDQYLVVTLGKVGNASTAALLRSFANDPEIGQVAADAILAIEQRGQLREC